MTISAQPPQRCSKCGKMFDTLEGTRQHERDCNGKDAVAGTPAAETPEQIKKNMEIEEGFEATDN